MNLFEGSTIYLNLLLIKYWLDCKKGVLAAIIELGSTSFTIEVPSAIAIATIAKDIMPFAS